MNTQGSGSRGRLIFAVALIAGLALAALLIPLLAGSDEQPQPVAADTECIDAWNGDRVMLLFGQHQAVAHNYSSVQILRLGDDGQPPASGERGHCATVFASPQLDPEPGASAQILRKGKWAPLSDIAAVTPARLGSLQSEAVAKANATLTTDGRLQNGAP